MSLIATSVVFQKCFTYIACCDLHWDLYTGFLWCCVPIEWMLINDVFMRV